jgi:hypothetical protein
LTLPFPALRIPALLLVDVSVQSTAPRPWALLASRTVDSVSSGGAVAPCVPYRDSMSLTVTRAAGRLGRYPEALHEFGARGADVHYGDSDFPATLPEAFAGGHRMLLTSTDAIGRRIWQHCAAIDAAAGAGVDHLVFTSHVHPVGNPQGSFAQELGEAEAILQRSRPAWTVPRFQSFAELQLLPAATAVQNGRCHVAGAADDANETRPRPRALNAPFGRAFGDTPTAIFHIADIEGGDV